MKNKKDNIYYDELRGPYNKYGQLSSLQDDLEKLGLIPPQREIIDINEEDEQEPPIGQQPTSQPEIPDAYKKAGVKRPGKKGFLDTIFARAKGEQNSKVDKYKNRAIRYLKDNPSPKSTDYGDDTDILGLDKEKAPSYLDRDDTDHALHFKLLSAVPTDSLHEILKATQNNEIKKDIDTVLHLRSMLNVGHDEEELKNLASHPWLKSSQLDDDV